MAGDEDEFDKEISEILESGGDDRPKDERDAEKEAEFLDLLFERGMRPKDYAELSEFIKRASPEGVVMAIAENHWTDGGAIAVAFSQSESTPLRTLGRDLSTWKSPRRQLFRGVVVFIDGNTAVVKGKRQFGIMSLLLPKLLDLFSAPQPELGDEITASIEGADGSRFLLGECIEIVKRAESENSET